MSKDEVDFLWGDFPNSAAVWSSAVTLSLFVNFLLSLCVKESGLGLHNNSISLQTTALPNFVSKVTLPPCWVGSGSSFFHEALLHDSWFMVDDPFSNLRCIG